MMRKLLFGLGIMLLTSCSITKYVPEGEKLYKGADVEFVGKQKLAEEGKITDAIAASIYPKPNKKLLGLVYFNLWVYFSFDNSKDKWYSKFLYNRFAEEPVYLEDVNIPLAEQIIKKEMQDEGYFNSNVEGEMIEKEQTGTVAYKVEASRPSTMRNVTHPNGDSEVDSLIRGFRKFSVKENERYRLQAFEIERSQITEYIRSKGFYDFNIEDIYYLIDTASIDSVDISMRVKKPENDSLHRKYFINNVSIYTTNGALGSGRIDSSNFSYIYKGLKFYEDFRFVDKKTIASNVLVDPTEVFSVEDYNLTLSRLINLNTFKYVNIQYEKSAADSLDVNILLTPTEYKSVQYDGEINTSDRSFLGSTLSLGFSNNNTFRRAEKFAFSVSGGAEMQYFGSRIGFSILNLNASTTYEVPRLLVPFKTREFRSSVAPKTFLKLENDYQLWLQYFNTNSTKANYGYEWNTESRYTFSVQPLFMDFINVFQTTELFDSIAMEQPQLQLRYQDQLIIGSLFSLAHTNRQSEGQRNSYYLRWNVETSGNTSTVISSAIAGVPISQYIRTDIEYRYTRKFTIVENLIGRLNFGIVNAYGNSSTAPFTKQFYMGGPTTLRGFSFRSVGPGRFKSQNTGNTVNPIDQFGDIRILINAEYRFPIYSVFRGATFFDAGNVWLLDGEDGRAEGQFKFSEFYKELAWNTGFGLRIDIDFISARLDFGIPLYTPSDPVGERWIHQSPEQGVIPWVRKNFIASLGIGYPF